MCLHDLSLTVHFERLEQKERRNIRGRGKESSIKSSISIIPHSLSSLGTSLQKLPVCMSPGECPNHDVPLCGPWGLGLCLLETVALPATSWSYLGLSCICSSKVQHSVFTAPTAVP